MADAVALATRHSLAEDLTRLGLQPGRVAMLHVSVRAIGWVVGGPDRVIEALLDVLGPTGTLMMMLGVEDSTYEMPTWPEERQRAYREAYPPHDPARFRAYRKWSILTEYLRTWPGARCSTHPEAPFGAAGGQAEWLMADHPLHYGAGPGSPLAKLCEAEGQVLQIGVPIETLTVLHYAECIADVPNKRIVRYPVHILRDGAPVWVEVEEFDTNDGIVPWDGDYFETIGREYAAAGHVRTGLVGAAESRLFEAAPLAAFGKTWMERHFAPGTGR